MSRFFFYQCNLSWNKYITGRTWTVNCLPQLPNYLKMGDYAKGVILIINEKNSAQRQNEETDVTQHVYMHRKDHCLLLSVQRKEN